MIYRGHDAPKKLLECLFRESYDIKKHVENIQPLTLTHDETKAFYKSLECCICNHQVTTNEQKARHHDHTTG